MSERDLFRHLVHLGALQERGDGTVHCPIPSFRAYLARAGGLTPNAEAAKAGSTSGSDGRDGWTPPEQLPFNDPEHPFKT